VEVLKGNLLSREDCKRAAENVPVVYHLAAGIDKSFPRAYMNSVLTTRNLLDALLQAGTLKRFVNISSFAVYSNRNLKRGAEIGRRLYAQRLITMRNALRGSGSVRMISAISGWPSVLTQRFSALNGKSDQSTDMKMNRHLFRLASSPTFAPRRQRTIVAAMISVAKYSASIGLPSPALDPAS